MAKRKNRKGFTLVELLVVIAIIALLLSILMPALNKVREQAKQVVCSSNLRSLGQLFQMYAMNYKDNYPMPFAGWDEAGIDGKTVSLNWVACLRTEKLIRSDKNAGGWGTSAGANKDFWACPSSDTKKENSTASGTLGQGISIGMNDGWTNLQDPGKMPTQNFDGNLWASGIKQTAIKSTASTVLCADVRARWVTYSWRWFSSGTPLNPKPGGCYVFRHKYQGSNFLMADGHVEFSSPDPGQFKRGWCRPNRFKYDFNNWNP
jgi:prepilin-type N-terminal cleavage/methylation domain-containing protein/prepilin-type processing-associated H-X9-DG protein